MPTKTRTTRNRRSSEGRTTSSQGSAARTGRRRRQAGQDGNASAATAERTARRKRPSRATQDNKAEAAEPRQRRKRNGKSKNRANKQSGGSLLTSLAKRVRGAGKSAGGEVSSQNSASRKRADTVKNRQSPKRGRNRRNNATSKPQRRDSSMPTAEEFVQKCLEEVGDEYEWGGKNEPGTPADETFEWDCSGLMTAKLQELGIDAPHGSTALLEWCEDHDTIIPLEEGKHIRGALLLREGHVAASLGNRQTIEAKGEAYGVGVFSADNRTFTHAGLVPGLLYDNAVDRPHRDRDEREDYIDSPEDVNESPSFDDYPTLRQGSRGENVTVLQEALSDLGFDLGEIDGVFGPNTEDAVIDYQEDRGLQVDGIVGEETWSSIDSEM